MSVETIVSSLNYNIENIDKNNYKDKVLIINQCDNISRKRIVFDDFEALILENKDRGIGKSRALGLSEATSEIVLFSDDDVVYQSNYTEIIKEEYKKRPDADLIFFNVQRYGNKKRPGFYIKEKVVKLNYFNSLKFGAVNITARRDVLKTHQINFDEQFGVEPFNFGEDSIFIYDCLKAKLNIYFVNVDIGKVNMKNSTWFKGYNKNFFVAKGAQFQRLSKNFSLFLMIQYIVRKGKLFKNDINKIDAFTYMNEGRKMYENKK